MKSWKKRAGKKQLKNQTKFWKHAKRRNWIIKKTWAETKILRENEMDSPSLEGFHSQ